MGLATAIQNRKTRCFRVLSESSTVLQWISSTRRIHITPNISTKRRSNGRSKPEQSLWTPQARWRTWTKTLWQSSAILRDSTPLSPLIESTPIKLSTQRKRQRPVSSHPWGALPTSTPPSPCSLLSTQASPVKSRNMRPCITSTASAGPEIMYLQSCNPRKCPPRQPQYLTSLGRSRLSCQSRRTRRGSSSYSRRGAWCSCRDCLIKSWVKRIMRRMTTLLTRLLTWCPQED